MFEGFPQEQTNVNEMVTHAHPAAKEMMNLFPREYQLGLHEDLTDWLSGNFMTFLPTLLHEAPRRVCFEQMGF